jgi:hypothetical protein
VPNVVSEDAVLSALWAYWQGKRGGRAMPCRRDIDPTEIPRLLPHLQLVEFLEAEDRFRYRLSGTAIAAAYGRELTGRFVDEVIPEPRRTLALHHCRLVRETAQPIFARTQYLSPVGAELVASRLILPLGDDPPRVTMLLIGQTCDFQSDIAAQLGSAQAIADYVSRVEVLTPSDEALARLATGPS